MYRFELLGARHVDKTTGKTYARGNMVLSRLRLDIMFPQKYRMIPDAIAPAVVAKPVGSSRRESVPPPPPASDELQDDFDDDSDEGDVSLEFEEEADDGEEETVDEKPRKRRKNKKGSRRAN